MLAPLFKIQQPASRNAFQDPTRRDGNLNMRMKRLRKDPRFVSGYALKAQHGGFNPLPNSTSNMADNISKAATLVKDPVCAMDVNPATSKHKVDHAGKSHFFCCAGCAEKFKSNPDKYLTPAAHPGSSNLVMLGGPAGRRAAAPAPEKQTTYVCPMCPQVRANKPGPCP